MYIPYNLLLDYKGITVSISDAKHISKQNGSRNIWWKWYWLIMITVMIFKPVQRRKLALFSAVNFLCRQKPQTNQLNNKIRQTEKVGMNCSTAFLKKASKLAVIAVIPLFLVLWIRNLHWRGKKTLVAISRTWKLQDFGVCPELAIPWNPEWL